MLSICLIISLLHAKADIATTVSIPATGLPPKARVLYGSAYCLTVLAIFGGKDENDNQLDDLWLFNFNSNLWTQMFALSDTFPSNYYIAARYSPVLFFSADNETLYLYSGASENGPQCDIWSYSLVNKIWNMIGKVYDFSPVLDFAYNTYIRNNAQYLCIFGGIDRNYLSSSLHL